MGSHHPFEHLKHKLWPKEKPIVKLAVWLSTTKSRESTQFPCVQMVCNILLESSWRGLQLCCRSHLIGGLHAKLWHPKIAKVPTLAILRLPLGSPETKNHLDVGPMERHRIYYKGEGGGFPQVRVVVNLMCPSCPWLILAPKMLQLCSSYFVLVLYRSVWVNKACQFFLVPSWSSNTPLYPSKVLRAKERASTFCSFIFFCLGITFESLKELGACHFM